MTVSELVQRLQREFGLDAAIIATTDGLVVEAAQGTSEIDCEAVAAQAVSGLLMLEALGQELSSTPRQAIVEFDRHLVLVAPLDSDTALVLLASGATNLGRLRLAVRRFIPLFQQLISEQGS